jgi:hypothetical protein
MSIHSGALINLLAQRHSDDVFIEECKNGKSDSKILLKMDGWAMRKSWAHPCISGYEVKVARSDFLGDRKWPGYLKYCNEFYFVCPPNVIKPEELGKDVGLLYCSANGGRLYTKKKAPFRNITIPETIFRYIIMRLGSENNPPYGRADKGYWVKWLAQKDEDKELGRAVSRKVALILQKRVYDTEKKNHALALENEKFADLRSQLAALGFNGTYTPDVYSIQQKLKRLHAVVPEGFEYTLSHTLSQLQKFKDTLDRLKAVEDVPECNILQDQDLF